MFPHAREDLLWDDTHPGNDGYAGEDNGGSALYHCGFNERDEAWTNQ
jgi:hypothetical protein